LPIPKISNENNLIINQIEVLVDKIVKSKTENLTTKELENEMDQLVCKLYNLNEEEKTFILK